MTVQIMLRHAEDDFTALTIANAMMGVGAEVVSVTDAGGRPFAKDTGRFIVWAKVRDEAHIADVDASIDRPNSAIDMTSPKTQSLLDGKE